MILHLNKFYLYIKKKSNKINVIIIRHVLCLHISDEGLDETEPNTVSLRRVIPVRDVNDNAPVFHNRPYIVNISEATSVGSEIKVTFLL